MTNPPPTEFRPHIMYRAIRTFATATRSSGPTMLHGLLLFAVLAGPTFGVPLPAQAQSAFVARIGVDLEGAVGEMYPMWAYFGYDEANYTARAAGDEVAKDV